MKLLGNRLLRGPNANVQGMQGASWHRRRGHASWHRRRGQVLHRRLGETLLSLIKHAFVPRINEIYD